MICCRGSVEDELTPLQLCFDPAPPPPHPVLPDTPSSEFPHVGEEKKLTVFSLFHTYLIPSMSFLWR